MGKDFKLIVCLDFDGVIHSYTSGWKGIDIIPDEPVPGAIDFIINCIASDFEVHVFSTRSEKEEGRNAMREWLHKHMAQYWIEHHIVQPLDNIYGQIEFPASKPPAWITIDDRAIQFNGVWPTMDVIANFAPWYRKKVKLAAPD